MIIPVMMFYEFVSYPHRYLRRDFCLAPKASTKKEYDESRRAQVWVFCECDDSYEAQKRVTTKKYSHKKTLSKGEKKSMFHEKSPSPDFS